MKSKKEAYGLLSTVYGFLNYKLVVLLFVLTVNCKLETVNCFAQELVQDRDFQQGFYVRDRFSGLFAGPITCDSTLASPVWNTAEWGSQTTFLAMTPSTLPDSMCQWADNNKDFRFGTLGAEEYELYFGVNSQSEFNNIYRANGEPWPHLLIEQRFSPPYDFPGQGPGCPSISTLDSLIFQIDSKLLYNQTIMTTGYDPSLHAAEFLVYFTVQNLNVSSSGYGKYVWLGMQLYDDRFAIPYAGVSYDTATATLINQIPYYDYSSETTHNGTWVHAQVNLIPYVIAALDTAWANGFLNESTDLADYKIGGMNMGWELPGMNISTVGVKGISLVAYQAVTGVNQLENENAHSVNIYPNPSNGTFQIQVAGGSSNEYKIEIYNVFGEKIHSSAMNNERLTINMSGANSEIYFLNIKAGDMPITRKLIIQK
ncbi:MAG: T9SS type A sorting domain-containing protein [Bacteroidetes bacterium]|nr:T9SS type A sorting domain-containing protein [Bacteroidota bacterium]